MNGTMCATSSKKKMTAILLGLTLALAPYGMTSAEAAAKSGTEAAPAVTAVVPPTDAVAAKDAVNAGEEAKAVKDAAKGEAQASPVKEDVTIDARSSLDQSSTNWQKSRTAPMTWTSPPRRRWAARA